MAQSKLQTQPGKPTGIIGRIVGYLMDIYNQEDNHWTVSLLDIGKTSKVLEIGFGTGLAIADAAKITKHGCIYGIDHSETMLEVARKRNRKAVQSGQVILQLGNVMTLPFEDNFFDIVYQKTRGKPPTSGAGMNSAAALAAYNP